MLLCEKHPQIREVKLNLDYSLNCKSANCIYIAVCKYCVPCEFYVGQTINPLHIRLNNHRACFKLGSFKYEQSALSVHVFEKHVDTFPDKLENFNFGILTSSSPKDLDRREDFYIYTCKADSISLNRIKVIS